MGGRGKLESRKKRNQVGSEGTGKRQGEGTVRTKRGINGNGREKRFEAKEERYYLGSLWRLGWVKRRAIGIK